MTYTQALRPMAVETVLGPDALLLAGLAGEEEVSRPFCFTLDLASERRDVDPAALIGTAACVTVTTAGGITRRIHGRVRRFRQVGGGSVLAAYQAELVPWLWMLSLSRDCRIYQRCSVPEIVAQVFAAHGHTDYVSRLVRSYPKREYCVQYRETHLDFVARLLEDEGIAYHFEHAEDKHTLVLTDSPAALRPCPGLAAIRPGRRAGTADGTGDAYTALAVEHAVHTRTVALADYDYLHPTTALGASIDADGGVGEAFDYPGGFAESSEGDRYARLRLEAAEARREVADGSGLAPALVSGHKVRVDGDGPGARGRTWLVVRVSHEARQPIGAAGGGEPFACTTRFVLAPADVPWRPAPHAPRPRVQGTQSALVVGKAGEEIWTDAHGRVKLHFYWDRHGPKNENSSCWVRCSSAWAGRGYGQFSVPRMGQEVLVDFLEGDPDRPVVVGRVFNAEQPPPCDPGGGRGVVSGMRSKTHKGQGYNGIEMNDTAGKEHFAVHAQYDMATDVGHDDVQTVTNDRKITVKGKHTEEVTGDTGVIVKTGNYTHAVATGTGTFTVQGAVKETYNATQSTTVTGKITISSKADIAITAATSLSITVGSATLTMKADGTVALNGKALSIIGDDEVKISAPTVAANGGKKATVGVGNQQVTFDTTKVNVSGAAINASAVGTHEIAGALVKIN